MGGPALPSDDDLVVGINVTPLVDITLVLLVVFMVTAKLVVQQGVPMDLPKAASAGATQTMLTVSVDDTGRVFSDGRPVSHEELRADAARFIAANEGGRAVVQAAGAARHDAVLGAVDALREAGVVKIAFAADSSPKSPVAR